MPTLARRALPFTLLAALLDPLAPAQPAAPAGGDTPQQPPALDLAKLPKPVLLGYRVEGVRRRIPVTDTVVIVPSREAFVDAISRWTVDARFPILIDDGSVAAREDIARFVRAYKPKSVERWEGEQTVWAQSIELQRQLMADALAKAWGAPSFAELPSRWNELRFIPPGVVILSESDPLCMGGLALAAGRGQIPLWFTRQDADALPNSFGGELSEQQAAALRDTLEAGLTGLGLPWNELGDAIDAVTIAFTIPGRVKSSDGERDRTNPIVALSDYLGRSSSGDRYAWTGLLVGDEPQGVYDAMCALFLRPDNAWLFNGYKPEGQFAAYDIAPTRQLLLDAGIEPVIDDAPFSGTQHWRRRVMRGVDAGLIHVNTSGMSRNFTLNPGVASSADVPALNVPAIVHFIHSFSAQAMGDAHSVGRRFIDNGAYTYVGSVDEPYLAAFQPPEQFVRRMLALAPLGAAARHDTAPVWKINIYGDPLITLGPAPEHTAPMPDLDGAADLDAQMRDALKSRDFASAAQALLLLGRDADLARLYNAARANKDATISPDFAIAAFSALFRVGDRDAMVHAANAVPPQRFRDSPLQSMLWQAFGPSLSITRPTADVAALLRDNLRRWNLANDAELAASATSTAEGKQAARAFLERVMADPAYEHSRAKLAELLARY